jgi:hypothetical protein
MTGGTTFLDICNVVQCSFIFFVCFHFPPFYYISFNPFIFVPLCYDCIYILPILQFCFLSFFYMVLFKLHKNFYTNEVSIV